MSLSFLDWIIIGCYFLCVLLIGVLSARRAGANTGEFFLGGRSMPWWLLGISMVATTFSTDTPNLVTDIVRTNGISGNWVWWAFLITGMVTVFIYARLWRRSNVFTDIEFYELRYSGKAAAFLRGFRAIYLGVLFNVMVMGAVSLAAIKIGQVLLGMGKMESILLAMIITVIYSGLGGFRSVLITDFLLFGFSLAGAIMAAVVACRLPEVGGLTGLFDHPNVADKLSLIPVAQTDSGWQTLESFIPVFLIPLAVQWWSVWYPGAEPGGGGYLVQRMLSAKDENHALGATLLFNICHYALRPWPWILVALASLVIFPDLDTLREQFPHVSEDVMGDDLAYPAMLTFLPVGIKGIVVASLIAAYMSTMSTHLNWGSSYVVNDCYQRFLRKQASQKELVLVGRLSTVVMMILAAGVALGLRNAIQAFNILLLMGAGTGLIFILRWFWYRINPFTEITGMLVSFGVGVYLELIHAKVGFAAEFTPIPDHYRLLLGIGVTTAAWLLVTLLTHPSEDQTLRRFYKLVRPGGPGWRAVLTKAVTEGDPITTHGSGDDLPRGILCVLIGCVLVYSVVFATGYFLYGKLSYGIGFAVLAALMAGILVQLMRNGRTAISQAE